MKHPVFRVLAVSGAYIAAFIGGGFASGQEILTFFVKYGKISFAAVVLTAVLFGVSGALILRGASRYGVGSFGEYLDCILPEKLRVPAKFLSVFFMISVFSVMISAGGEAVRQMFNISAALGGAILCVVCLAGVAVGIKFVTAVNGVLGLMIGAGIIAACWYIMNFRLTGTFAGGENWFFSGISYAGYNMISSGVVLVGMSGYIHTKKEAVSVGVITGGGLLIMMAAVWGVINIFYGKIPLGEIPMLTLALRQGKCFGILYTVLLGAAIYTTAVSCGWSGAKEIEKKTGKIWALLIMGAAGMIGGGLSFSGMVNTLYRVSGYGGCILLAYIIIDEKKFKIFKKLRKTK